MRPRTIGGSDAAIVIGHGRFEDSEGLFSRKIEGEVWDIPGPTGLKTRGHKMEPTVAEIYNATHDVQMILMGDSYFHDEMPWAHASPDGVSEDGSILFEIKSPNTTTIAKLKSQDHEFAEWNIQVQHNMAVMGIDQAVILVLDYNEFDLIPYYVPANKELQAELMRAEESFYDAIVRKDAYPPLVAEFVIKYSNPPIEVVAMDSEDWRSLASQYAEVDATIKELGEAKEALRDDLITLSGENQKVKGHGITLTKTTVTRTSLDQKAMMADGIDVDKYTVSKTSPSVRITVAKS